MHLISELTSENSGEFRIPEIIKSIGNTPLIELNIFDNSKVRLFAKAEWLNPGGSVKDRAAWSMIQDALLSGHLDRSKTILEATSGNTGIALAMIASALKIPIEICIPKNASNERLRVLRSYGANLILTDPLEGIDGSILKARELDQMHPSKYYYTDQYTNQANWKAHYDHTAVEILKQTNSEITHFISGLGTSGTFMGTSKRLKEENNSIKVISFQPDGPFHGIEGLKDMNSAFVPQIYDDTLADDNLLISTERAYHGTRILAKEHGLLVGVSSGAAFEAAKQLAETLDKGVIVTIFPDVGDRYLSETFWGDI